MKQLVLTAGTACVAALCGATEVVWMNTPADALWNFTSLNWDSGADWTDGNQATFRASDVKSITIDDDVAPSGLYVADDGYEFGGTGTLTLNGPVNVLSGYSATISAPIVQTSGTLAERFNKQGTGILQQIQPIEKEVMRRGEDALDGLRKSKSFKTMDVYYDWVDEFLLEQYKGLFGVE